ncbi:hypothetical protein U472_14780 [Orenia metallireducens]|uniref:Uncharacterized protein n=1 Tax=Orenia metallireducens TaxID=1413210 RepID=A0A1C0A615_9FIRM|nr:hypothetical protein [Orenia metallireducens]OCL25592.1 hypothetical protein U472_14780 [Orenia metallireducens]
MKKLSILIFLIMLAISLSGCLVSDKSTKSTQNSGEISAAVADKIEAFFLYNEFDSPRDNWTTENEGVNWNPANDWTVEDIMSLFNSNHDEGYQILTIYESEYDLEYKKDFNKLEDELTEMGSIFIKQPGVYHLGVYYLVSEELKSDIEYQYKHYYNIDLDLKTSLILKDGVESKNLKVIPESQNSAKAIVYFLVYEQNEDIGPLVTDYGTVTFQFTKVSGEWLIDRMVINYLDVDDAPVDQIEAAPDWVQAASGI